MAVNEPGTPLAEQVADIGARLKEIEVERANERQAGALPGTGWGGHDASCLCAECAKYTVKLPIW